MENSSNRVSMQNATNLKHRNYQANSTNLSTLHAGQYSATKNNYSDNLPSSKISVKSSFESCKNDIVKPHRGHSARQMIALHALAEADKV